MHLLRGGIFVCLLGACFMFPALAADSVENDHKPKGKPQTLEFMEDLVIKSSDDENYIWSGERVSVDVDKKGNIYAVVPAEAAIFVYDSKGQFIKKMGGKGEGPGQYQNLISFQLVGDGAVGFENFGAISMVNYFDENMEFKSKKPLVSHNMVMEELTYGNSLDFGVGVGIRGDEGHKNLWNRAVVINGKFEEKKLLFEAKPTIGFDANRLADGQYWVEFMAARFKPLASGEVPHFAFSKDGKLYFALANKYEIGVYDAELNEVMTISKKYKPNVFTPAELKAFSDPFFNALQEQIPSPYNEMITTTRLNQALELADFPSGKHPVQGLKVMEDGHLLVLTDVSYEHNTVGIDIFSPKGEYLGEAKRQHFEMARMIFKNGFAYAFRTANDDDNEIVRYRYKLKGN